MGYALDAVPWVPISIRHASPKTSIGSTDASPIPTTRHVR